MPYLYTGQRQDPETGLWYFKNRVYDGESGRFLRRDLIGYGDGPNSYLYGRSSPSARVDRFGLSSIDAHQHVTRFVGTTLGMEPSVIEAAVSGVATADLSPTYTVQLPDFPWYVDTRVDAGLLIPPGFALGLVWLPAENADNHGLGSGESAAEHEAHLSEFKSIAARTIDMHMDQDRGLGVGGHAKFTSPWNKVWGHFFGTLWARAFGLVGPDEPTSRKLGAAAITTAENFAAIMRDHFDPAYMLPDFDAADVYVDPRTGKQTIYGIANVNVTGRLSPFHEWRTDMIDLAEDALRTGESGIFRDLDHARRVRDSWRSMEPGGLMNKRNPHGKVIGVGSVGEARALQGIRSHGGRMALFSGGVDTRDPLTGGARGSIPWSKTGGGAPPL
jgi:RHS repeat-associated protein